jgi:hypothetical protein
VDQDRGQWQDFLNTAINLFYKSKEFLGSLATISFSTNVTQWRYRSPLVTMIKFLASVHIRFCQKTVPLLVMQAPRGRGSISSTQF